MSATARGGRPYIWHGTAGTTPAKIDFLGNSVYLRISASAAMRVYFTAADAAAANDKYITVPATGFWDAPIDAAAVWVVAPTGSPTYELLAVLRYN